jgi:hypothetical protein
MYTMSTPNMTDVRSGGKNTIIETKSAKRTTAFHGGIDGIPKMGISHLPGTIPPFPPPTHSLC